MVQSASLPNEEKATNVVKLVFEETYGTIWIPERDRRKQ
jgi:hypothetical protein